VENQDINYMEPWSGDYGMDRYDRNKLHSMVRSARDFEMLYPDVYYKVQPYVMMMCDEMDSCGTMMPSQEMVDYMCDCIYEDLSRMYPDLTDNYADVDAVPTINGFGGFGRFRRRRGPFRDLITILLLTEFFRRRRRF